MTWPSNKGMDRSVAVEFLDIFPVLCAAPGHPGVGCQGE